MAVNTYDWVPFYEEFADKLKAYRNDRTKIVEIVKNAFNNVGIKLPTLEKSGYELTDIDPFTIFGLFNKSIREENRIEIATALSKYLNIKSAAPKTFNGIPTLLPLNSTFYRFKDDRQNGDIENLWNLFYYALEYKSKKSDEIKRMLYESYDIVINQKGVGPRITMGLYWIAPNDYLNLDSRNRWYIYESGKLPKDLIKKLPKQSNKYSSDDYFGMIKVFENAFTEKTIPFENLMQLSDEAWTYSNEVNEKNKFYEGYQISAEDNDMFFTKDQWLEILNNKDILGPVWGGMLAMFYTEPDGIVVSDLAQKYGTDSNSINGKVIQFIKRVQRETNCKLSDDPVGQYWPIAFLYENISGGKRIWKLRPELYDALTEFDILKYLPEKIDNNWWPSKDEYDPDITRDKWLEILNNKDIMEDDWYTWLAMFYDYGGEGTCSEIADKYGVFMTKFRNSLGMHFAERVCKFLNMPIPDLGDSSKLWPVVFLGKYASNKAIGSYIWKLRPELYDALTEFDILKYLPEAHPVGSFDSWKIIDENTAIKHCDKSFFEYGSTGVPKEICWFFDGDVLDNGEQKSITLIHNNQIYSAAFSKDQRGSSSIRWVRDFKNVTNEIRRENLSAYFIKIDTDRYTVEFKSGEPEMTTKQMIDEIKKYIASKGFTYEGNLIENFYLSLKSKPFVILAGTSGTGKTRLAKLFAEAIGAKFKLVPVKPDWSDSSDMFGHLDLSGNFIAGPVIGFISEAIKNPSKPYILCLDEMNLARVEYYFSDFLSIMETRERKDGRIITDKFDLCGKAIEEYGEIYIPDNFYIIGTVNMDETTFPFSKKVLDRANTIEFSYVDLSLPKGNPFEEDVVSFNVENSFMKTEYIKLGEWITDTNLMATADLICSELNDINNILKLSDAHVGYRVRDEICFYRFNNYNAENLIDDNAAMDNQIMQKILPRIQGSSSTVKTMLCELFKHCAGDFKGYQTDGTVADEMKKVVDQKNCKYQKSAEKIQSMTKRFEEDGFTSYWI